MRWGVTPPASRSQRGPGAIPSCSGSQRCREGGEGWGRSIPSPPPSPCRGPEEEQKQELPEHGDLCLVLGVPTLRGPAESGPQLHPLLSLWDGGSSKLDSSGGEERYLGRLKEILTK